MALPRLPALAEVAWTPQALRSWPDFRLRLAGQARYWTAQHLSYTPTPDVPWQ